MNGLLKIRKIGVRKCFNLAQIKCLCTTAQTLPQETIQHEETKLYTRVIKKKPHRKPFMKNAFLGEFDNDVLGFPEVLNNEELKGLTDRTLTVTNFVSSFSEKGYSDASLLSDEVFQQCRNLQLFSLQAPEKVGGLELSETENCLVLEELSPCSSLATSILIHQYLGVQAIVKNGTEFIRDKYLPKLSSGECLAAFCLLERNNLDPSHIDTHTVKQADGSFVSNT